MPEELRNLIIIEDGLDSLPSNPYTYESGDTYYTYYAFSASTIETADIGISESWGQDVDVVSLPNIGDDVYALRITLQNYIYELGESSIRTCTYSGSVCSEENLVCRHFEFDITQHGCPAPPSKYTVLFDLNGHGTGSTPEPQILNYGDYVEKPETPAETGYYFNGWFLNQEGSGEQWSFNNNQVFSNITLYAKWLTSPKVSLSLPLNIMNNSYAGIGYGYSENPQSPANINQIAYFEKITKTWSTCIISDDTVWNAPRRHSWGGSLTSQDIYPVGSTQIYSIYLNGESSNFEFVGISIDYGSLIPVSFIRRYDMPNHHHHVLENVECQCVQFTVPNYNKVKIYPIFICNNTRTVSFYLNGHGSPQPEVQNISYGGYAIEPTAPTDTWYTFGGWYKEQACTNAWDFTGDTVTSNTTLYAKWTTVITYTVTVSSTTNCQISINNVVDGSQTLQAGAPITGIATTPNSHWSLADYRIEPEHGSEYTAATGTTITMPSDNITIIPECENDTSSRKFTMIGYGSDAFSIGVYDENSRGVTSEINTRNITQQTSNRLYYEWGNINTAPTNNTTFTADAPYVQLCRGNSSFSRVGAGNYGDSIYFAFGISEQETQYEPYGFLVQKQITDSKTETSIIVGQRVEITDSNKSVATRNAIFGTMTLEYSTNIKCLVKLKNTN